MAREVAQILATLCCGVFFGAALYISLVQHPAALETGGEFAARFFPPMYARASVMQASLAIMGTIAALGAYLLGAGRAWLFGAVLLASVIPFTFLVIDPVNQQLKTIDPSADRAVELLIRWDRLHLARTVASGLSFVMCLVGIVRRESDYPHEATHMQRRRRRG
ncbi:MAG TPA: DUF1772 domain-containing protein [Candidatus Binatia bacterium]|jgi:hypothetical protein